MSWAHRVSPGFHRGANMVKLGGYMVFRAENPLEWSTLSGFHVPMSSSEQGEGFPIWPRGVRRSIMEVTPMGAPRNMYRENRVYGV